MPKLWKDSIKAHRREVHDAILEAAASLATAAGVASVTMSDIATKAGIGRATLYKYFSDVSSILVAWHARQVMGHLEQLAAVREGAGDANERLTTVLETFAFICHEHHGSELAALLHREEHVAKAHEHLSDFISDLIREGAESGTVRDDVAPPELATFCLSALAGAAQLPSRAAVRRLVVVTLAGLRPTSP